MTTSMQDVTAEQSVLGAMILSPVHCETGLDTLATADFARPEHQRTFAAIVALAERGERVDSVMVRSEIAKDGAEEWMLDYVETLPAYATLRGNLAGQMQLLTEYAKRRRIWRAGQQIATEAAQLDRSLELIAVEAESLLLDATAERGGESFENLAQVGQRLREQLEKARSGYRAMTTGIASWDSITGGLEPGTLHIIAARPNMGKTSAALSIVGGAAAQGKRVAVFSLEMPSASLLSRMHAAIGNISGSALRTGMLTPDEFRRYEMSERVFASWHVRIDDTPSLTVQQIFSRCRAMRQDMGGLDLVVIDYIGIIAHESKSDNRAQQVGEIAKALQAYCRRLEVPFVVLAQINRLTEGRSDKRPMLSDIKESGGIEEAADTVTMLYRPLYYAPAADRQPATEGEPAEWIVAKNRRGEVAVAKLGFWPAYTRFADTEDEPYER